MNVLPFRFLRRKLTGQGLLPESALARLAVLLTVMAVPLYLLRRTFTALYDLAWYTTVFNFVLVLLVPVLVILAARWVREKMMWRLRNRLIITYIFIGFIPLFLLVIMAGLAAYLFAGQFSTFVITSDLQADLRSLQASNATIASEVAHILRRSNSNEPPTRETLALDDHEFRNRHVTVWYRDHYRVLQGSDANPLKPPASMKDNAIVQDGDSLYLRASTRLKLSPDRPEEVVVVSSMPLDKELLERTGANMGVVALYGRRAEGPLPTGKGDVTLRIGDNYLDPKAKVSAGTLAAPKNRLDFEFLPFGTLLSVMDWQSGNTSSVLISVRTRPSLLYARLFRTLGDMTNVILAVLFAVAIFFALIELLALLVGIRLTRTMTKSVAQLYDATQHIEVGDLSHRIPVTRNDQLAALERSFNSMTESLQKLIAEQKEKQRIESELAIAQEVQALLFPRDITSLEGFEVHGVCRPARTVSGDYYDFLPIGPNRLGVAVGDISGKGISAALLMATVHAFVRAYTLVEQVPALAAVGASAAADAHALVKMSSSSGGELPPGTLLAMLNHQLYRSTPSEKYATMFLGFYDQRNRTFNYSNAGHLPPMLIGSDGTIRQLDTGGLVVGLFGDVTYSDDSIEMKPGDIFVAYSDGITEPENEFGEFGEERLVQLVHENRHLPLERISEIVVAAVQDWIGGNEQPDDVTLVLARSR